MTAGATESPFKNGQKVLEEQQRAARAAGAGGSMATLVLEGEPPHTPGDLLVQAEIDLEGSKRIWNAFILYKHVLLNDPECFDVIDGHKEMNRTGATRLALPFGLSIEGKSFDEGRVQDAESGEYDYRYRVQVRVSKGSRFVDGIGSCRLSEIPGAMPVSKREHFALTKAWTRASKRAIADILGGTEAD